METKGIMISAHNPVTGPRHLGHYFGAMKSLAECQYEYDTIVVLDDLMARIMYPKDREHIQNRAFYVVQDFINSGLDVKKNSIVLTSQIHALYLEHLLYYSTVIDFNYCNRLYENSFLGSLKLYQRKELGVGNYASVAEWIYPQIGLAALTLGLGAKYFQGGEEIIGFTYIMEEISENLYKKHHLQIPVPVYVPSKQGYINGTDGTYMIQRNCLFLSEEKKNIYKKVHEMDDKQVFIEWYTSMHLEQKAAALSDKALDVDDKIEMAETLVEELKPFRENKLTNRQIIRILNSGKEKVSRIFAKTAQPLRDALCIPSL